METIQIVPDITLRELIERKTQALDQEVRLHYIDIVNDTSQLCEHIQSSWCYRD